MKLLLIEDDEVVSGFISGNFSEHKHDVAVANDGRAGLSIAMATSFDVLIVDRMLPKMDGIEVIRRFRINNPSTPILILSALADVEERITGLEAGADDYLVKPFAFSELRARVEVLSRRVKGAVGEESELVLGDLRLNLITRKASRSGKKIELQPREFRLLECLIRNVGQVMTRTMLLEHVWNYYFDPRTNIIDVHVSRIRQKVDKGFDKSLIKTVRGAGYMICESG